jgi:hypothetical protein
MPPKPVQQVKGSGAEWYNIDFDPEILKKGAVVSSAQVIKGQLVYVITGEFLRMPFSYQGHIQGKR